MPTWRPRWPPRPHRERRQLLRPQRGRRRRRRRAPDGVRGDHGHRVRRRHRGGRPGGAGRNRIAGEWGHTPLPWPRPDEYPAPPCWCGRHGCLELYLAGPGLARDATGGATDAPTFPPGRRRRTRGRRGAGPPHRPPGARPRRHHDILDPDVIVLGGGLSQHGPPVRRSCPRAWPATSSATPSPRPSCATGTATAAACAAPPGSGRYARAMPRLCRDCHRDCAAAVPGLPHCGGHRLVRHADLFTLALAHVDCDAFYASVEKRDRPELPAAR